MSSSNHLFSPAMNSGDFEEPLDFQPKEENCSTRKTLAEALDFLQAGLTVQQTTADEDNEFMNAEAEDWFGTDESSAERISLLEDNAAMNGEDWWNDDTLKSSTDVLGDTTMKDFNLEEVFPASGCGMEEGSWSQAHVKMKWPAGLHQFPCHLDYQGVPGRLLESTGGEEAGQGQKGQQERRAAPRAGTKDSPSPRSYPPTTTRATPRTTPRWCNGDFSDFSDKKNEVRAAVQAFRRQKSRPFLKTCNSKLKKDRRFFWSYVSRKEKGSSSISALQQK